MQTCKKCIALHKGKKDLIPFCGHGEWNVEFTRIRGLCWLCSFLEGYEAWAEYRLARFTQHDE